MSVPGICVLFHVVDRHSSLVYDRHPCFELVYVAHGVQETDVDAWYPCVLRPMCYQRF